MKTVPIHDAKTNLSKYIAAAKRGEQIAIGAYGKYEVSLVVEPQLAALQQETPQRQKPVRRQFGTMRGKIWAAPDAFSPETDAEIAQLMTEGDIGQRQEPTTQLHHELELNTLKGKVWIASDAFSEEFDNEISESFEANREALNDDTT